MKKLFVILFLFLMISSCKKEIEVPESSLQQVFGTWQWYQSSGGHAIQILTPESEGYSKHIEITDKGIYKEYKNHVRRKKLTYTFELIDYQASYKLNFKDELINFSVHRTPSLLIEIVSLDTLFLYEDVFDGFMHCYVRK